MEYLLPPSSSKNSDSRTTDPTEEEPFLVGHSKMKQGLFARAALYANNASKATPAVSQFNGILRANRDPIVWGDASNRYNYKRVEINNNTSTPECFSENEDSCPQDTPSVQVSQDIFSKAISTTTATEKADASPLELAIPQITTTQSDCYEVEAELLVFNSNLQEDFETQKPKENFALDVPSAPKHEPKVLSFNSTQQLRSGFFRSIKRQYSPILPVKTVGNESPESTATPNDGHSDISNEEEAVAEPKETKEDEPSNSMSKIAKQKLEQLRKRGSENVDVPTGLQWIRLELHEMREQDKTLFLQLIKLHSAIKDLRSDMSGAAEFDSYDDLHSAASLWWPRRGYNLEAPPDFSSSDGAHLIRNGKPKPLLRRGFSLNYPPIAQPRRYSPEFYHNTLSPPNGS